jgi:hypothetical protein
LKKNYKIYYFGKERPNGKKITTKKNYVNGLIECRSPFQAMFVFVFTRLVEFGSKAFF